MDKLDPGDWSLELNGLEDGRNGGKRDSVEVKKTIWIDKMWV
jgi:hypothetical protein